VRMRELVLRWRNLALYTGFRQWFSAASDSASARERERAREREELLEREREELFLQRESAGRPVSPHPTSPQTPRDLTLALRPTEARAAPVCMYVCMYVCVYIYTYMYKYVCVYVCVYVYMRKYIYTYIYIHTHTYINI
jgi:hypothetical protein